MDDFGWMILSGSLWMDDCWCMVVGAWFWVGG